MRIPRQSYSHMCQHLAWLLLFACGGLCATEISIGLVWPAAELYSRAVQTSISLPFITATADGPKHIETNLSRAKFEELASDLLDRCRIPVEQALKDANLSVSDINEVILVGGSTRIPAVQVPYHFRPMQAAVCLPDG